MMIKRQNFTEWALLFAGSLALHLIGVSLLSGRDEGKTIKPKPVKVKVIEVPPEPQAEKKEEAKPPPPKKEPKKTPSTKPRPLTNTPPPPPVLGVSKDATSETGTVAIPLGNTLMVEDQGIRLDQEPAALAGDLSAPAELIKESVKIPQYTDQALDASLEGTFVVDVYVDEAGIVKEADLKKKIGFGMDQRVIDAALAVKFKPRKNQYGRAEAGWTEIKFRLQIP